MNRPVAGPLVHRRGGHHAPEVQSNGVRYTRSVSWKLRIISIGVVAFLMGAPIAGTVCALLCASAPGASDAAASGPHGSDGRCTDPADSAQSQIGSTSRDDCSSHDGSLRVARATLTAVRAYAGLVLAPVAVAATDRPFTYAPSVEASDSLCSPPGIDPPTRTPVVLRV